MKKIFTILITLITLVLAWWLLSPLFITTHVEEALPVQEEVVISEEETITEPTIEKRGTFTGVDSVHHGSGDLLVVTDGDRSYLRFENFSVTNGPDLFVTLNKGSNPEGEHVLIAPLKGAEGDQNYDVSAYNLEEYQSVSIYCRAFSVEFATASL